VEDNAIITAASWHSIELSVSTGTAVTVKFDGVDLTTLTGTLLEGSAKNPFVDGIRPTTNWNGVRSGFTYGKYVY
jgi:hypothetical protein